jgi:uncharacterized membrane protein
MEHAFIESQWRSFAKLVTWRIFITISNTVNTFLLTGSWVLGFQVAAMALILGTVIFYVHDRLWDMIPWGKKDKIETQLRIIVRNVTYRIAVSCMHIFNGYYASGDIWVGVKLAAMSAVSNSIIYFLHEEGWNFIPWGRKKPVDIETDVVYK